MGYQKKNAVLGLVMMKKKITNIYGWSIINIRRKAKAIYQH